MTTTAIEYRLPTEVCKFLSTSHRAKFDLDGYRHYLNKYHKHIYRRIYDRNKIDIIMSDSFQNFLDLNFDNKFCRIFKKFRHLADVSKCNYIALRGGEKITYHPRPEKQEFNSKGDYKREGRQEIKPLALIKLLYGERAAKLLKNWDIEQISDRIKAISNKLVMHHVSIEEAYSEDIANASWASSSCMAGDPYPDNFYSVNPDNFTGVIFKVGNEIVGRCLEVTAEKINGAGTVVFYDRLYFKYSYTLEQFYTFCDENNKICKNRQSYTDNEIFRLPGGETERMLVYITLQEDPDIYPFCDTMKYLIGDNLYNYKADSEGPTTKVLNSTSGGHSDEVNDGWIYSNYEGEYIREEDGVCIQYGRHEGQYVHEHSAYYSDHNDGWILA